MDSNYDKDKSSDTSDFVVMDEEKMRSIRTKRGGYSSGVRLLARSIIGLKKTKGWKKALSGRSIKRDQYLSLVKFSNYHSENTPSQKTNASKKKPRVKVKKYTKNKKFKGDDFLVSKEWRIIRYKVLQKYGYDCMACGRSKKKHGVVMHVDHIKPRSKYPELALELDNLQVLCEDCNLGKLNLYEDDLRPN